MLNIDYDEYPYCIYPYTVNLYSMPLYRQYTSIIVAKSFKPRSYALFKASPMRKALIIDEKIQKKAQKRTQKQQKRTILHWR